MKHPFYPVTLQIPNYVPSQYTITEILGPFFSTVGLILLAAYVAIAGRHHSLSSSPASTKGVFVWFLLCGFIHTCIEGYYAANSVDIAGQSTYMVSCVLISSLRCGKSMHYQIHVT
jgi:cholestenol delta-isomerase